MFHTAVTHKDHVVQIFTVNFYRLEISTKKKRRKKQSSEVYGRKIKSKRDFQVLQTMGIKPITSQSL